MVKKLLKHELVSYMRILLPIDAILLIIAAVARIIQFFESDTVTYGIIFGSSIFALVVGIMACMFMAIVVAVIRFYKNFFTAEGYLTFTLPVKKSELINSKVIMGVISSLATSFVVLVNIIIILVIGFFDNIIKPDFWKEFSEFFSEVFKSLGVYTFVYVLEIILVVFLANLLSTLFLYDCVAIASMLVKKAKVITAIGIYYVANGVISTLFTIFSLFGMSTIIDTMSAMKTSTLLPLISLLGSGIIVMLAMFTALLYLLQY